MYKATIIIPHKNIPKLLKRCLDSIPNREDIKIVVVDDNSDPSIVDFSNFPGKERANVTLVFLKENLGAGGARNEGLKLAEGKWLLFADSDDFFHENLISFIDQNFDNESDLIVFDTDSVLSDSLQKVDNRENIVSQFMKKYDENILRYSHHAVWGKMFRLDLVKIRNIQFQKVAASNDAYFAALFGVIAHKIEFFPDVLYCCTVRGNSICTRVTIDNTLARISVVRSVNQLLYNMNISCVYWMNRLGPLFNMNSLNKKIFLYNFVLYLKETPLKRLMLDIKESGLRYLNRFFGRINDKDIKKLQK